MMDRVNGLVALMTCSLARGEAAGQAADVFVACLVGFAAALIMGLMTQALQARKG